MRQGAPLTRRDIRIDAVWDIEGEDWDTFVVGGIRWPDGEFKPYFNQRDLVNDLLKIKGTVWAHFGGGYDFKWLLDRISGSGAKAEIVASGGRIVSVEIGHTLFCDSWALAPMKLKDFTQGLGISKEELGLPCECGDDCGGYCSINRFMEPAHEARVVEYLQADCDSLYFAINALRDYAEEHDLDLGRTIGSSAWRNVQRLNGIQSARSEMGGLDTSQYKFARKGYYGGRTQLYKRCLVRRGKNWEEHPIPDGGELDVNSMYPWALREFAVPTGSHYMLWGAGARRALANGRPGIYRGIATVPESHLPPLPVRYNNSSSIGFPTGRFLGTWALPEIIHAESLGCKFEAQEALLWTGTSRIFRGWIDKLWNLRAAIADVTLPDGTKLKGKKTPMGIWLKLYMNSLTGKFGSDPEKESYTLNPVTIRRCSCKCGRCSRVLRKCKCDIKVWMPPDFCPCNPLYQVSDRVWASTAWRIEDCSHVQFSGWLTSGARVRLNQGQLALGDNGASVVYSDTDSIHSSRWDDLQKKIKCGKELGEWEASCRWKNFMGYAPKVYTYDKIEEDKVVEIVSKAKGVPMQNNKDKPLDKQLRPIMGKEYPMRGIIGFKAGLAAGKFFVANRGSTRVLKPTTGDRVIVRDSKGNETTETRAPRAQELALDEGW